MYILCDIETGSTIYMQSIEFWLTGSHDAIERFLKDLSSTYYGTEPLGHYEYLLGNVNFSYI